MTKQPKFIVVDGPDGAGKTTIVKELKDYLTAKNYNVHVGRGLGTGNAAESIRSTLFNDEIIKSSNYEIYGALMCLIDCYETFVLPILKKNNDKDIIILDRYVSTYFAYQVHSRKSSKAYEMLKDAFNVFGTEQPDVYIKCEVDTDIAFSRLLKRSNEVNYLDRENIEFRQNTSLGFDLFFKNKYIFHACKPSEIVRLDCNKDIGDVNSQLYNYLDNTFVSYLKDQ